MMSLEEVQGEVEMYKNPGTFDSEIFSSSTSVSESVSAAGSSYRLNYFTFRQTGTTNIFANHQSNYPR
jgi:hypothetical protein